MDYSGLVQRVLDLEFIHDEVTADAAVKAVMGIMVSRMEQQQARRLAAELPAPLTYEKLRARQGRPIGISPGYYKAELCDQFGITESQAEDLIHAVYNYVKDTVSEEARSGWESGLPMDWVELVRQS